VKCKTTTFSTLRGNITQHIDFSRLTFYFSRNYQYSSPLRSPGFFDWFQEKILILIRYGAKIVNCRTIYLPQKTRNLQKLWERLKETHKLNLNWSVPGSPSNYPTGLAGFKPTTQTAGKDSRVITDWNCSKYWSKSRMSAITYWVERFWAHDEASITLMRAVWGFSNPERWTLNRST